MALPAMAPKKLHALQTRFCRWLTRFATFFYFMILGHEGRKMNGCGGFQAVLVLNPKPQTLLYPAMRARPSKVGGKQKHPKPQSFRKA